MKKKPATTKYRNIKTEKIRKNQSSIREKFDGDKVTASEEKDQSSGLADSGLSAEDFRKNLGCG